MKKGILSLSFAAAIVAAAVYFLNSTLHLAGYAVTNRLISSDSSSIIKFIISNYRIFSITFISILIISYIIIYLSFIIISKERKNHLITISSWLVLISLLFFLLLSLLMDLKYNLPSFLSSNHYKFEYYAGFLFLLLGISLIISRGKPKYSNLLGTFYVLESLILISAIFLPIRFAEFSIAIRITESFFFYNEIKN